jgi:hypothetical protein
MTSKMQHEGSLLTVDLDRVRELADKLLDTARHYSLPEIAMASAILQFDQGLAAQHDDEEAMVVQ